MSSLLEYAVSMPYYSLDRRDPAFYCDGYGHTWVASIKELHSKYVANIYCNGEMKIDLDENTRVRYTSDLLDNGINTDEKLFNTNPDSWHMNPWFDIYMERLNGYTDVHMDAVHFDVIKEGINLAVVCIRQAIQDYGVLEEE